MQAIVALKVRFDQNLPPVYSLSVLQLYRENAILDWFETSCGREVRYVGLTELLLAV